MTWDNEKKENFKVISHRVKWVPGVGGHQAHFCIADSYNLYLDELFIMINFLQAIGDLRFNPNHQECGEDL